MKSSAKEKSNSILIFVIIISILGLVIRCLGLNCQSSDLGVLTRWYQQLVNAGSSLDALRQFEGDYPLSYIFIIWLLTKVPIDFTYTIKFASIILDYLMAFLFGKVAETVYPNNQKSFCLGYGIVMLLPTVIMNSAFWGQSDVFYAAFLMGAILCLLKEKYPQMMIFVGLAFSFKLQTVFILPFLLMYYWIERKFSALWFTIIPVVMIGMHIPAILAGYSPMIAFTQFLGQSGAYPYLYYFYPNFWFFFQAQPYFRFSMSTIFMTITALLIFIVLLVRKNVRITKDRVLPMVMWIMYTCVMFLPAMHERYTYMPEILACLYGMKNPKRWWLPVGLLVAIIPKYLWTFGVIDHPIWLQAGTSIVCIATYLAFTVVIFKEFFGGMGSLKEEAMYD